MLKILLAAHPWKPGSYEKQLVRAFNSSVQRGWLEGIMLFLGAGIPIDVRDHSNNEGVLHWVASARKVNTETVAYLLEQGAVVNARNRNQATPLHLAVNRSSSGDATVVDLLIATGAELNAQDDWGDTPLHRAFYPRNKEVVAKLFEACANPYVRDSNGKIPMEGVSEKTLRSMFTFLVRSGSYAKNQACPEEVRLSIDATY